MKKTAKTLMVAALAALMIAGTQVMAFAEDSSSQADVSSESQAENADLSAADAPETPTTTAEGNINAAPNTGITVLPFAIAALGAAAVPVILKTRK